MLPDYVDVICDFVEEPRRTAREVNETRPIGLGFLSFAIAGLSLFLAHGVVGKGLFSPNVFVLGIYCGWVLFSGLVLASAVHFLAELAGGKGSAQGLFILFGLSDLVLTFLLPGALLVRLLAPGSGLFSFLLFSAFGVAIFSLRARSVRDNYGISSGKAWLVLLAPYLGIVFAVFAFATLALVGVVSSAIHFLS